MVSRVLGLRLLAVLIGVSFALDTLCTQAYGAGNFVDMAYGCQRTFLVQVRANRCGETMSREGQLRVATTKQSSVPG